MNPQANHIGFVARSTRNQTCWKSVIDQRVATSGTKPSTKKRRQNNMSTGSRKRQNKQTVQQTKRCWSSMVGENICGILSLSSKTNKNPESAESFSVNLSIHFVPSENYLCDCSDNKGNPLIWYHRVSNLEVRRLTEQPLLTSIIQKRRLMLFGHLIRMDESANWLQFPRVIGEVQLDDPTPPGWPLWRTTYLCTASPMRMLSKWPWISRCGDYWQQAELRTNGACRIMMMND